MPADLLLPVEGDSYVDRERALAGELGGGLEEEVRVALVVDRAARVEVAVADLRLEGRRVPEIERRRRLDVEMAVEDHRRRGRAAVRGRNLAERERLCVRLDQLCRAPRPPHEVAHPRSGP